MHHSAQVHVVNLLRKVVTAQEDERGRIARNLHDQLGQRLTELRLSLERIQSRSELPAGADDELSRTLALVQTIDSEVGFLAWELRPAVLDHLGLAVALPRYVREWSEHYGIEAKYGGDGLQRDGISREAEIALYRIAQEALTNVAKHAHASRVDVFLESRDGYFVLVVEDDGVGFDPEHATARERGIGLLGMRERAGLIGAQFELESRSGGGHLDLRALRSGGRHRRARAMTPIRVLLAEDHETVRQGLRLLLESQPDIEVVAEAANGLDAVKHSQTTQPHVVILDISMPEMNGLAAAKAIRHVLPKTAIVALTRHDDDAFVQELMAAGASGYVLKQSRSTELLNAVRAVAAGGQYSTRCWRGAPAKTKRPNTARVRQRSATAKKKCCRMMAVGHSNKGIAADLKISIKTVEVHKANAMRKLGLRGRIDVVRFAILHGWLQEP